MKCKKCGSKELEIVQSGPHNKLVCQDCLAFQKFLSGSDLDVFLALKNKNNDLSKYIDQCPECGMRNCVMPDRLVSCEDVPRLGKYRQDFFCDDAYGGCGATWVVIFEPARWMKP